MLLLELSNILQLYVQNLSESMVMTNKLAETLSALSHSAALRLRFLALLGFTTSITLLKGQLAERCSIAYGDHCVIYKRPFESCGAALTDPS